MLLSATLPLSVTVPFTVSTLMLVPSTPDSAISAAFTLAVTAASSTVWPAVRSASPVAEGAVAVLPLAGGAEVVVSAGGVVVVAGGGAVVVSGARLVVVSGSSPQPARPARASETAAV